ncbi:MAG: hypothetical protein ABR978_06780 [Dehalococcoidia bacterium]|jgi:hypothetical protein
MIGGVATDNIFAMNGFGVGASVAVGIEIGARLVTPDLYFSQVLMVMLLYGSIIGLMFHFVQWALQGVRLPFNRR